MHETKILLEVLVGVIFTESPVIFVSTSFVESEKVSVLTVCKTCKILPPVKAEPLTVIAPVTLIPELVVANF